MLLGTATFFEGYDSAINAVVLRDLAHSFHVNTLDTSVLTRPILFIGLGSFGALLITTLGDRFGRRPLLISTTVFYTLFTGLTAMSRNLTQFVIFQFFARAFLVAEYATAITIVSEEFPAERRGRALGTLTTLGAFGLPIVAISHLLLKDTALGWRWIYLLGLIPLIVVAVLRTRLRETSRWLSSDHTSDLRARIREVVDSEHRGDLIKVSAIFFFSHFALFAGSTWWPFFARGSLHFKESTITLLLSTAYPLGVFGYYAAGRAQDRFGRKPTGRVFMIAGSLFGAAAFHISSAGLLFPVIVFAVFFGLGVSPVLGALATEMFPTNIRATAVAIARSVFGTLGAITGPFMVGVLADRNVAATFPSVPGLGSLSWAVTFAALFYLPAILILSGLRETAGVELDMDPIPA